MSNVCVKRDYLKDCSSASDFAYSPRGSRYKYLLIDRLLNIMDVIVSRRFLSPSS